MKKRRTIKNRSSPIRSMAIAHSLIRMGHLVMMILLLKEQLMLVWKRFEWK
jgi:hypothetical protein